MKTSHSFIHSLFGRLKICFFTQLCLKIGGKLLTMDMSKKAGFPDLEAGLSNLMED